MAETLSLRAKIEQSPMGAYQWMIVAMAAIMNLLDGFDVLALAFTATAIRNEFGLTGIELGYLLSAGLFGMAAGSLFLAPLADKIGRRPLLLMAVLLSTIGMLGSAFISQYQWLGFWRVITGLGVGAVLGGMFAVMLQGEYGWRSVFLAGAILTGLFLVLLFIWLPESIDFLTTKQPKNAEVRLNLIAKKIGLAGDWKLPAKTEKVKTKLPISQLFSKKYLHSTLLIWTAFFAIMFSFYFISSWTPALLKEAGMTTEQSVSVGMMISLGGTCGALIYGLLASRWTARGVLILFTVLSSAATIIFILSSSILWIAMVFGILVGALMNGCISGLYTLNPLTYDADIRSTGVGWSIGIGRIGAILAPTIAGQLLDMGWDKQSLYVGVGFVMLLSTVAIFFLKSRVEIKT